MKSTIGERIFNLHRRRCDLGEIGMHGVEEWSGS